jgi:hypothetical protein
MPFRLPAALLCTAALCPQVCLAAHTEYHWIDLHSCKTGVLSEEIVDSDDYKLGSAVRVKAAGWQVYESSPRCYGFCKRTEDGLFICRKDSCPTFPLAGATYKSIMDASPLLSFKCIKGCRAGVPRMIHDVGYENDEDSFNIELGRRWARYSAKCEKQRKQTVPAPK